MLGECYLVRRTIVLTDHIEDEVELMPVVTTGEKRPPVDQLSEDTANSPDVTGEVDVAGGGVPMESCR